MQELKTEYILRCMKCKQKSVVFNKDLKCPICKNNVGMFLQFYIVKKEVEYGQTHKK